MNDAVYATVNVRVKKYLPQHKFICNMKNFDKNAYQKDFSTLPLSVVYGLESLDDKVSVLNSLITECIDRHVPLRRVKVTRPPAHWMHSEEIRVLQAERNQLRTKACDDNTQESWNKIKTVINQTKRAFLSTALSSKRPKEVWRVIHRVLNPSPPPLPIDPNNLNMHFATTTEGTLGTKPHDTNELLGLWILFPCKVVLHFA